MLIIAVIKCIKCAIKKDINEFYLFKGKLNGRTCKICRKQIAKKKYRNNKKQLFLKKISVVKHCNKCNEKKKIVFFVKHLNSIDGYTQRCKICINAQRRQRYGKLKKAEIKLINRKNKKYNGSKETYEKGRGR